MVGSIDALQAYIDMVSLPVQARTVIYSDSLLASDAVKQYGNYKLSFYCPCAVCNGTASGKTASGTTITEGRTIAVDSRYIPLGSRVYIDGWGLFIAEDTGGAIKGNRIDVDVSSQSSHTRAYELGIESADVWVLEGERWLAHNYTTVTA